jgi:Domain of unknown function (DUF4189)
MRNLFQLLGVTAAAGLMLAACGGGNSDPTPYGSIAWDGERPSAAIVVNFASQEQANVAAVERCGGGGCAVILEFSGKGSCGALAVGGGRSLVTGVATGGTREAAEAAAIGSCNAKGSGNCSVPSSLQAKCM